MLCQSPAGTRAVTAQKAPGAARGTQGSGLSKCCFPGSCLQHTPQLAPHLQTTSPAQAPARANLYPFSSSHTKDKASQASSSTRDAPGPLKRGARQGTCRDWTHQPCLYCCSPTTTKHQDSTAGQLEHHDGCAGLLCHLHTPVHQTRQLFRATSAQSLPS